MTTHMTRNVCQHGADATSCPQCNTVDERFNDAVGGAVGVCNKCNNTGLTEQGRPCNACDNYQAWEPSWTKQETQDNKETWNTYIKENMESLRGKKNMKQIVADAVGFSASKLDNHLDHYDL